MLRALSEVPRECRPGRATPGCAARVRARACAAKTGHVVAHCWCLLLSTAVPVLQNLGTENSL